MTGSSRPLRCAFVVQGEGRGHMTQALAAAEILRDAGHRICAVHLGTSDRRPVPGFFRERIRAPVRTFRSPILVPDSEDRGMSVGATFFHNLVRAPAYARGTLRLGRRLREEDPDVVVNFFDLLGAAALLLFRPGRRRLAVGHHFLVTHDDFPRPDGTGIGWWGLSLLTVLCGLGASRRLALSFRPLPDPGPRTAVFPPLLRRSVLEAEPTEGRHLQVYVLNPGYARELKAWHAQNREVVVEAFWDRADVPECVEVHPNLRFHRIDDRRFVEGLRTCRGLATTAGFESVCEAMYLGKPVLLVPTSGHVEQACNAEDALRSGAGIRRRSFALDDLLTYLERDDHEAPDGFRDWVRSAPSRLLAEIESDVPDPDRPPQFPGCDEPRDPAEARRTGGPEQTGTMI